MSTLSQTSKALRDARTTGCGRLTPRSFFEVKEFRADSDDFRSGSGVFDPYPPLREKINAARNKFRELKHCCCCLVLRSGPRNLDSGLSGISIVFQAAVPKPVVPKYTTSGVRRPSEL